MVLILALMTVAAAVAKSAPRKKKFPGGKCYIYRFALKDKQGTDYSLDRPQRFLSHESVERRRRQNLPSFTGKQADMQSKRVLTL